MWYWQLIAVALMLVTDLNSWVYIFLIICLSDALLAIIGKTQTK
jgi:hypothetical protein